MQQENTVILGIESSCDDTSASVIKNGKILSNVIAQQAIHEQYGGVVPELASRAHQQNIIPVVDAAIKQAGITKEELSGIAFTAGPGLMGALLVGVSFAKSLALSLNIPLMEVNHMQGHILAHFIEKPEENKKKPSFPFICLTVSGGHTQLVKVNDYFDMEIVGSTLDDAAGEAFDKMAKVLHFPYPGGPLIDKHAKEGDATRFQFTHPRTRNYDYSFSGLKTQFVNFIRNCEGDDPNFVEKNKADICASIQDTIIKTLFSKLKKVADDFDINQVAIAGGVSANSQLRRDLGILGKKRRWHVFIPDFQYCTDNAGMIAMAGYFKFLEKDFVGQEVTANARLKF
ncbi:MAG: tRNA (adenosine(37)-N6)-threonylcarbamoyltransferase complex transferase subunit TsaD [Flavobacteriales bacterium]|tara:strand:- start:2347 stop:3375 length:1029 start_codon:yes stop_codon:yes gene_type:complete